MRILVVEDDEFIAKGLTTVLSNQHYAAEVATDGQAGWELIEAFAHDPPGRDVIKLDGIGFANGRQGYQMPIAFDCRTAVMIAIG